MSNDNTILYIPSNPKDVERMYKVFDDMSNQKTKAEAIADYLKEAKKQLKEDYDIPLGVINKMFSLYHEQKAPEYFEQQREMEMLYDTIFDKGE